MSSVKAVTARIAHTCETCSPRTADGRYRKVILPGHRYLRHVVFPGDDGFEEATRPHSVRECASCAIERDDFTATSFDICGFYCCGIEPCVLPFQKGAPGHDHACKRCAGEAR